MAPVDLEPLYDALMTADPVATGEAVAEIASRIDQLDPAQIPEVVEALSSLFYIDLGDKPHYVQVVEDTVAAIASIGAAAIPTIMFLMCDADLKATLMHGRTLGRMGPAAYGPLKDLFYRAENAHQKALALFALAKMHEAALMEIFPDLAIALDDSDREVRDTAARTMGRVISAFKPGQLPHDQVSQAFERLMFRLSDNSPVVREHVSDIEDEVGYDDPNPLINTDPAYTGIMGGSRGGSPTYLAKLRDSYYGMNEINRAIVFCGSVTDWFSQDIKTSCSYYINNNGYVPEYVRHYCNEDYNFFKRVLEPYLHGEITFEEARHKMLLSSPRWMAKDGNNYVLNHVQVNHGMQDDIVRLAQSQALQAVMGFGGASEFHFYQNSGHVPAMNVYDPVHGVYYDPTIDAWLDDVIDGD